MKGGSLMEIVPALQARSNTAPGPKGVKTAPKISLRTDMLMVLDVGGGVILEYPPYPLGPTQ